VWGSRTPRRARYVSHSRRLVHVVICFPLC
jgi:hypothetical protein